MAFLWVIGLHHGGRLPLLFPELPVTPTPGLTPPAKQQVSSEDESPWRPSSLLWDDGNGAPSSQPGWFAGSDPMALSNSALQAGLIKGLTDKEGANCDDESTGLLMIGSSSKLHNLETRLAPESKSSTLAMSMSCSPFWTRKAPSLYMATPPTPALSWANKDDQWQWINTTPSKTKFLKLTIFSRTQTILCLLVIAANLFESSSEFTWQG